MELLLDKEISIASDPDANPEDLAHLAKSGDLRVRRRVAVHPSTPLTAISDLARDTDWVIRYCLASRKDLPLESICLLSKDPFTYVRAVIFTRLDLDSEFLSRGAKDNSPEVRACVANNPLTAQDTLIELTSDKDTNVASLSRERLRRLRKTTQTI